MYNTFLFVETSHKFITPKLPIHKPGSSSVHAIICDIISTDEDAGLYGLEALQ